MIDHFELLKQLSYDAETGKFYWRVRKRGLKVQFGEAGCKVERSHLRYLQIRIEGQLIYAHRLAWFYVNGEWPEMEIDHINGDGLDNRIANLRLATRSQQGFNTREKPGRALPKGVYLDKRHGTYYSHIVVDGKVYSLGRHKTPERAKQAYDEAAARLHGEFLTKR